MATPAPKSSRSPPKKVLKISSPLDGRSLLMKASLVVAPCRARCSAFLVGKLGDVVAPVR